MKIASKKRGKAPFIVPRYKIEVEVAGRINSMNHHHPTWDHIGHTHPVNSNHNIPYGDKGAVGGAEFAPANHSFTLGFCEPFLNQEFGASLEKPVLYIQNIGDGNAKRVNILIKDEYGRDLDKVERYALTTGEYHRTRVVLRQSQRYKLEVTFEDTSGKMSNFSDWYTYPP